MKVPGNRQMFWRVVEADSNDTSEGVSSLPMETSQGIISSTNGASTLPNDLSSGLGSSVDQTDSGMPQLSRSIYDPIEEARSLSRQRKARTLPVPPKRSLDRASSADIRTTSRGEVAPHIKDNFVNGPKTDPQKNSSSSKYIETASSLEPLKEVTEEIAEVVYDQNKGTISISIKGIRRTPANGEEVSFREINVETRNIVRTPKTSITEVGSHEIKMGEGTVIPRKSLSPTMITRPLSVVSTESGSQWHSHRTQGYSCLENWSVGTSSIGGDNMFTTEEMYFSGAAYSG